MAAHDHDDRPILWSNCAICQNQLNDPCVQCQVDDVKNCNTTIGGRCRHVFHTHCIERWFSFRPKNICPIDDSIWIEHFIQAPITSSPSKDILKAECGICRDAMPEIVNIPCGHLFACWPCSKNLKNCPCCQAPIFTKQRIIISAPSSSSSDE